MQPPADPLAVEFVIEAAVEDFIEHAGCAVGIPAYPGQVLRGGRTGAGEKPGRAVFSAHVRLLGDQKLLPPVTTRTRTIDHRPTAQMARLEGKPGKREKTWVITNNGKIVFTYKEAEERYGIRPGRCTRAIDELVRVGLIDIAYASVGLHKKPTLYAISERWKLYGTPDFVEVERPQRGIKLGFKKGNTYGYRRQNRRLS